MNPLRFRQPPRMRERCLRNLNAQVLHITKKIHSESPEIEKYIDEMVTSPVDETPTPVSPASMRAYSETLNAMLDGYNRKVIPSSDCADENNP
jgi:hypothetical protein